MAEPPAVEAPPIVWSPELMTFLVKAPRGPWEPCPTCPPSLAVREPAPRDDPDGTLGPAYWRDLVARFGRCTCPVADDGKDGNCNESEADGCALCKRLDPGWPCPSRDHIGYGGNPTDTGETPDAQITEGGEQ